MNGQDNQGGAKQPQILVPLDEFVRQIGREAGTVAAKMAIEDHSQNCPARLKIETCGRIARHLPHVITATLSSIVTVTAVLGVVSPKLYAKFEEKIKILQTIKQEIEKTQSSGPAQTPSALNLSNPLGTSGLATSATEKPK